jgi:hypothetical protein
MKQQTIEVEGLPEGWKAVAYRIPKINEHVLGDDGKIWLVQTEQECKQLVVEKIQPRRIVLEETDIELPQGYQEFYISGTLLEIKTSNLWKEVKE